MRVILFLLVFNCLLSCNSKQNKSTGEKINAVTEQDSISNKRIVKINECDNNSFIAILEENLEADSNAFILTLKTKKGDVKKVQILNVRPSFSQINYCTKDYVVVGFSCGGPCYSQVFISIKDNETNQQFDYANRVSGEYNIITHFENEEFDNLIVQNLDNGKRLNVNIRNCEQIEYSPCYMDTQYIINNRLFLEYDSESKHPKKKTIGLQKIL